LDAGQRFKIVSHHTAAEVIHQRADAGKPLMGLLTARPGKRIRLGDVAVAKNYLTEEELQTLNRIVNLYIEYAELQALERKPMTMRDWITKLDEFLIISGRKLLDHAGKIHHQPARFVFENAVDAGDGLHQAVTAHRLAVSVRPCAADARPKSFAALTVANMVSDVAGCFGSGLGFRISHLKSPFLVFGLRQSRPDGTKKKSLSAGA
jgi:hypothetical protein